MRRILFVLIVFLSPIPAFSQAKADVWQPFRVFIGDWHGTGGGEPGTGQYERSYRFIFGEKFIEVRNKSTYAPQPKNPKGEVHEDVGYISYDKGRKLFVLRQFHKEGFVNQFRLESISADGKTIVFVSESIENIPAGFRAKESYRLGDDGAITETFEMAEPSKDFQPYSSVTLKRAP